MKSVFTNKPILDEPDSQSLPEIITISAKDNLSISLYSSIDLLPKNDWCTCLSKDNLFLSPEYLSVAQNSQLPALQFRYAILYNSGNPIAVIYFQLVNLSDRGMGGIFNLEEYGGIATSISTRINDLLFNPGNGVNSFLLVCGNLLVSGEHAISAIDDLSFKKAIEVITPIKQSITRSLGRNSKIVALMVKDFYEASDHIAAPILKSEYFLLNTDPEMIVDINPDWKDFDHYLAALSSKYRIRANSARAKMENVVMKDLSLEEILNYESTIFELNEQVMKKAPVKLVKPSSKYFINLKKTLGQTFNIKGFFMNDQMIAFTSSVRNKVHYEAHFIGLDYKFNKDLSLYQNILYSHIEDAINFGASKLYFGRTALEIKSTTGAKPFHLACYIRFVNRVMNTLAKPLVSSTGPRNWIPRDPFKN